jgi:hypothetical protein
LVDKSLVIVEPQDAVARYRLLETVRAYALARLQASGAEAAARTYFNKDAKDLTPAQAALMAGLIQAPSAYDPTTHFDLAQQREQYVLQGMVDTNAISAAAAQQALAENVKSEFKIQATARQSKAPHFVDYVPAWSWTGGRVQPGGLACTTLTSAAAVSGPGAQGGVKDLTWANVNNSALSRQTRTG